MDLVQVDDIDFKTAETVVTFNSDRFAAERIIELTFIVPDHSAFREHIRARSRPVGQCLGNNFFGMSESVNGGGIDPVYTLFKRTMNRCDRISILLVSPAKLPTAAANRPGAKTDRSNFEVRVAKFSFLHASSRSKENLSVQNLVPEKATYRERTAKRGNSGVRSREFFGPLDLLRKSRSF